MAIKKETTYITECDICKKTVRNMIGVTDRFESENQAKEAAESVGWSIKYNQVLCTDCH